ncbi:MAG: diguanylate cyclase, partial [Anaerovoracaceae bacterium]
IVMPVMDGFEFLEIKKNDEQLADLPVIAITGAISGAGEEAVLEAGANDYLQKPFKPTIIKKRLSKEIKLQKAIRKAEIDPLTKLLNRTAFQGKADAYFHQQEGQENLSSIFIIDIDNFKQVNDKYGHVHGDNVLVGFANILRSVCRKGDLIGRLGGDEFVILLKNVSGEEAVRRIGGEIVEQLNSMKTKHNAQPVSCTIGISMFPKNGTDRSTLYFCADEAMYYAKNMGKNQYAFFDEEKNIPERCSWMNKEWILDEQESYIHICDVTTHQVYYTNQKSSVLLNRIEKEEPKCFCYQLGFHEEAFDLCSVCDFSIDNPLQKVFYSERLGQKAVLSGKIVSWEGKLSRMVTITPIPEQLQ